MRSTRARRGGELPGDGPGGKIEDNGDAGWMGRHRRGRSRAGPEQRNGRAAERLSNAGEEATLAEGRPRGQKGTRLRGITLLPRRAGAMEAAPRDEGAKGGV